VAEVVIYYSSDRKREESVFLFLRLSHQKKTTIEDN
jgi:hypothetical protein